MTLITDEHTEHVTVSDTCACEPFDAAYELVSGVLVCLKCKLPRPVVLHEEDTCPACGGAGCNWCSSWGGMP